MYLFILQTVRSIEDPEKNPKAVDNWIDSIRCDHICFKILIYPIHWLPCENNRDQSCINRNIIIIIIFIIFIINFFNCK